jgi:cell division protein FtsB
MRQGGQGRPRSESQALQQRTELEVRISALNMQRGELQSQFGQLDGRRHQLQMQLAQTGPGAARTELQTRLAELDARSQRLDQQIQGLNDQISAAMGELASVPAVPATPRAVPGTSVPPIENLELSRDRLMRDVVGVMAVEAIVLALVGVVFWRVSMRRVREQFTRAFDDQAAQLGQLQQAVDVIGVEVERISEGQRYVAKVLTEGSPAGVAGQPKVPAAVARDA